ncbi:MULTISPECIES: tail fiber assembly protein [unclassified Serratia (in: enterobacteria)]|uniref:tail fiber assembly protein n=1 Tax=unclassified Serratia (in: enterobacteria) TaxID=2647522 RepID=UPI000500151B|nr:MULTISPECIES: tail fiber assembly protein [unclassified Serratia (in: enterobacteria)]KFK91690.1 tail assembly protein [Serratia sp. Ag2]KFK92500.1 tail assembly protein [Serratia sp. Ag1]
MSQYSTTLPTATLNDEGLATIAGWLTVYSIDPIQREYQQASLEYIQEGVGLPAFCYADKPTLPKAGLALVRSVDGLKWETRPDYRGQTVYRIDTGQSEVVTLLGELSPELTLLAPQTPHDKWDGKKWVTDLVAQREAELTLARNELTYRQRVAAEKIIPLDDAVSLGMATEEETEALQAWKAYRVQLNRVDLESAPNIEWPRSPDEL